MKYENKIVYSYMYVYIHLLNF